MGCLGRPKFVECDGRVLVECRPGPYLVGYLPVTVAEDVAVVRSFWTATLAGTPTGNRLRRLSGLQPQDLADLGLDRLSVLVGSDVVAVKGCVTNRIVRQNADDAAMAFLEFASGASATIAHAGLDRPPVPVTEEQLTGEIVLTRGLVKTVPFRGELWVDRGSGYEPVAVPDDSPMAAEIAAFAEAVRMGEAPPVSHRHARSVVAVLLAVEEASRTGREVRLA